MILRRGLFLQVLDVLRKADSLDGSPGGLDERGQLQQTELGVCVRAPGVDLEAGPQEIPALPRAAGAQRLARQRADPRTPAAG